MLGGGPARHGYIVRMSLPSHAWETARRPRGSDGRRAHREDRPPVCHGRRASSLSIFLLPRPPDPPATHHPRVLRHTLATIVAAYGRWAWFAERQRSKILIRGLELRSTVFAVRKMVWHHRAKKPETRNQTQERKHHSSTWQSPRIVPNHFPNGSGCLKTDGGIRHGWSGWIHGFYDQPVKGMEKIGSSNGRCQHNSDQ